MLQIGNKPIDTMYVGGKLVQQVYLGGKKIYPPGAEGTEALYAVIEEAHAGTLEDPIPYVQNMLMEKGKYYTQYGVVYECILTTLTGYPNDLYELPSIVKAVE